VLIGLELIGGRYNSSLIFFATSSTWACVTLLNFDQYLWPIPPFVIALATIALADSRAFKMRRSVDANTLRRLTAGS
jgi:hypothetical protein